MTRMLIEIDDAVLARAKEALGLSSTSETVNAALRQAAEPIGGARGVAAHQSMCGRGVARAPSNTSGGSGSA